MYKEPSLDLEESRKTLVVRSGNYQMSREAPVAERDYHLAAMDYYLQVSNVIMMSVIAEDLMNPRLQGAPPEELQNALVHDKKAFLGQDIVNAAAVNLSKLDQGIDEMEIVSAIVPEFYNLTGNMLSCDNHKMDGMPKAAKGDLLLLCHPVKHDTATDIKQGDQKIKDAFFGFLLAKEILDTGTLDKNGILLGTHADAIETERRKMVAAGVQPRVKPNKGR